MRIVIAPDSFKECLTAIQVSNAISKGILRVIPDAQITAIPVADGGEGTVHALITATGGKLVPTSSVDALNRPITSFFGVLSDNLTAVVEMAAASGIELLSAKERNPLITSTFGTGLLIKAALDEGYTNIVVAIGGSATNDGGAGMAQALGFGLYDAEGSPLPLGGGSLHLLHSIDSYNVHPLLNKADITVACDVTNPLLGPAGATYVFGPQKGATPEILDILEANLQHFSKVIHRDLRVKVSDMPGAGAAGGLGAGLLAFCNAHMVSGFELVSQLTQLEEHIRKASLVFTAEGKIDSQTAHGKTISGVARMAQRHGVPVIALAGMIEGDLTELYSLGLTSAFAIAYQPMSLEESKARASELLEKRTEQIMRTIKRTSNPSNGFGSMMG
ncbi:MAG TPA: glycerate kinase [Prolixibacteraceae bacterium]|nr:glycerate kinase [Prolixibacteraceae bacterium]